MNNEEAVKEALSKAKAEEETGKQSLEAEEKPCEKKAEAVDSKQSLEAEDSPSGEKEETADCKQSLEAEEKPVKEAEKKEASRSKKKDKSSDKIKKLEEEVETLRDKNMRLMAEFDNFRKRTDKEKSHMYTVGSKEVIEKILPIVDSFERGLKEIDPETSDPFEAGINMVYKQMLSALEELGVKQIDSDGLEFDPAFHNAVMHIDDPQLGENIIAETFQKGYMYKDEVVRYAMVKVAN